MTALAALAAAAIAPPEGVAIPATLEPLIRQACAGAWRAVEVVLAGDVLRGRLSKTRDTIVRDAVDSVLALHGNVGVRSDALASLRAARDGGALDGPLELASVIVDTRGQGAVAAGRVAVTAIRRGLTAYRELDLVLADADVASLLVDAARAIFRSLARDPELARWAIGPTGSPGRDRALAAFAELAASPESVTELETLIAMPIHLDDNVQFTVYRPRAIDPGRWHQLLAFAHLAERRPGEDDLPDPVEEVQRQAAAVLGDKAKQYQPIVQDSGAAIPAEGELTFVPEFPGIEVNPPRRSFMWLETVHREEFRIRAGRELDGKSVRGRVTVFLGHIAIAEVACTVKVDAARPEPTREPTSIRAYRKIFASYSHRDLEIVNQFETYARALGDEYLRDWVHLRTGEVWTDRLCQLIDQADAFQLFWSKNSMHSQFVRQEYEYALTLSRASFVRPTYWEDPMPTAPGLPPEALLRLHFQKLGGAMIGAAGRGDTDTNVVVAARKKRMEAKFDTMEREQPPPIEADHYAGDHDVTDPQYSLPEMPAAESSARIATAPPDIHHRLSTATDPSPVVSFEDPEEAEPDTARIELKESLKREAINPRAIITDPGVGPAETRKPAGLVCATCRVDNPANAPFCRSCGSVLGARAATAAPAKAMAEPIAMPLPAPATPMAIQMPGPTAALGPPGEPNALPTTSPGNPPAAPAARPSAPSQMRPAPAPARPSTPMPGPPAAPATARPFAPVPVVAPRLAPPPAMPMAQPAMPPPSAAAKVVPPTTTSPGMPAARPSQPAVSPIRPSPSSPISTTSPGIAPPPSAISAVSARPHRPSEAPAPTQDEMPGVAESPWQRPAETSPAASIVSPFAPTVPQETYKPVPGDPIYEHPTNPDPKKRKTLPNAPRRSFLPLLLIALGILVLLAILLYSSTA